MKKTKIKEAEIKKIKNICVFCGAKSGKEPNKKYYEKTAEELGKLIATKGYNLIYGAGNTGLMGKVSKSCLDNGGFVEGSTTPTIAELEKPVSHKNHKIIVHKNLQVRKDRFLKVADVFLALPGGFGTYDEIFEVIVSNQIGQIKKPIFLIDIKGYYKDFYKYVIQKTVKEGFAKEEIIHIVKSPKEVFEILENMKK